MLLDCLLDLLAHFVLLVDCLLLHISSEISTETDSVTYINGCQVTGGAGLEVSSDHSCPVAAGASTWVTQGSCAGHEDHWGWALHYTAVRSSVGCITLTFTCEIEMSKCGLHHTDIHLWNRNEHMWAALHAIHLANRNELMWAVSLTFNCDKEMN